MCLHFRSCSCCCCKFHWILVACSNEGRRLSLSLALSVSLLLSLSMIIGHRASATPRRFAAPSSSSSTYTLYDIYVVVCICIAIGLDKMSQRRFPQNSPNVWVASQPSISTGCCFFFSHWIQFVTKFCPTVRAVQCSMRLTQPAAGQSDAVVHPNGPRSNRPIDSLPCSDAPRSSRRAKSSGPGSTIRCSPVREFDLAWWHRPL